MLDWKELKILRASGGADPLHCAAELAKRTWLTRGDSHCISVLFHHISCGADDLEVKLNTVRKVGQAAAEYLQVRQPALVRNVALLFIF